LNASIPRAKFFEMLDTENIDYNKGELSPVNIKDCFGVTFKMLTKAIKSKKQLKYICDSAFEYFHNDNVIYLEIRSTPKKLDNCSEIDYINEIIDSIERFSDKIVVRYLISINRAIPPEFYDPLLNEIKSNPKWQKYIVGLDYSGDPYQRYILDYSNQISLAKELGLKLAIHTAEIPEQQAQETPAI